jgi:hypothetical protein
MSYSKAYVWSPECIVVECDCEEKLVLTASEAVYRCGTDHTSLVCEERVSDGKMHPWDEEYRERRKGRDEYLRAVHQNWLEWRVIE